MSSPILSPTQLHTGESGGDRHSGTVPGTDAGAPRTPPPPCRGLRPMALAVRATPKAPSRPSSQPVVRRSRRAAAHRHAAPPLIVTPRAHGHHRRHRRRLPLLPFRPPSRRHRARAQVHRPLVPASEGVRRAARGQQGDGEPDDRPGARGDGQRRDDARDDGAFDHAGGDADNARADGGDADDDRSPAISHSITPSHARRPGARRAPPPRGGGARGATPHWGVARRAPGPFQASRSPTTRRDGDRGYVTDCSATDTIHQRYRS